MPVIAMGLERYADPDILIPLAAMTVILFVVVFRVLGDIEIFKGSTRLPVACCVTLLAVHGMDRIAIDLVISHYVAMGVAILVGVASLIGSRWKDEERRHRR